MRTPFVLLAVILAATLSGCISDPNEGSDDGADGGASPPGTEPQAGWPAIADAKIRPGVPVVSDGGSCTSNFVYQSSDNTTLYLGLAAHCLVGEEEEEKVRIGDGIEGVVAYNSWYTMDNENIQGVSRDENDFALIRIHDADRHLVHPALLHFGGPVGLAEQATAGERILTYGNTPLRAGLEPSNSREGYVIDSTEWYTRMYIATPGIPGDSGSAVLNGKGEALGVLIHLAILPYAASNGAVNVAAALEFAAEHAEIDAQVSTWDVLDPGVFPDAP